MGTILLGGMKDWLSTYGVEYWNVFLQCLYEVLIKYIFLPQVIVSNFSRIYHQNQRADKRRAQKVSRKQNTAKNAISQKSEINVLKLINLEVCTLKQKTIPVENQKRELKSSKKDFIWSTSSLEYWPLMWKAKYYFCPKTLLSNYKISCPESAACPDPNCQGNERSCFCCQEARSRGKIGCSGEQTKENEPTCAKIIGSKAWIAALGRSSQKICFSYSIWLPQRHHNHHLNHQYSIPS